MMNVIQADTSIRLEMTTKGQVYECMCLCVCEIGVNHIRREQEIDDGSKNKRNKWLKLHNHTENKYSF